jgi:hypothetical protein
MVCQTYYQNAVPHAAGQVGSFWWKDVCTLFKKFRGICASDGIGKIVGLKIFWRLLVQDYIRLLWTLMYHFKLC